MSNSKQKPFSVKGLDPANQETEKGRNTWEFMSNMSQVTIYSRKAGSWSGGHFHKGKDPSKNPEIFILISGTVVFEFIETSGARNFLNVDANKNPQLLIIQPNVLHRMKAITDCKFIECRATPFDRSNPDTFPPEDFPIKTNWGKA